MSDVDFAAIWRALPMPALVIAADDRLRAANDAAELFFSLSAAQLCKKTLADLIGPGSRLADLMRLARSGALSVADNMIEITSAGAAPQIVDAQAARLDGAGAVLLTLHPRGVAQQMDRSLSHQAAARSLTGMAAMLAHEVRNPLAGISGAAQLLEMSLPEEEHELTALIRDEARRIGDMVARFDAFGDAHPNPRRPVNIHDVLNRAIRSAQAGFATRMRFVLEFDPSLPPAAGDPDRLVQVFQNLFKNSSEASGKKDGTITIRTAYSPGVALAGAGGRREGAPLLVTVQDDGAGVPEMIRREMFEPFVSSKPGSRGLGLAMVSKIVADHGGAIDCESAPGRTVMRLRVPMWRDDNKGGKA